MKSLIIVSFLFHFAFVNAQLNLDSGLVACYPLNGHAIEMIYGNNGSVNSVTDTTNKNGKPVSAMKFEGTSTSYIELPENSLKPNSISFSAWIRPVSSIYAVSYIVFTRNSTATGSTNNEAYALAIMASPGGKKIRAIKSSSGQTYWLDNTTLLSDNTWYHVCFTMDNSDIKIYLNGLLEGTLPAPGFIAYQNLKKIYLGGSNEVANPKAFKGAIDNVRFYNRTLHSSEILMLYQNDPACFPTTQSPVASFSVTRPCVDQLGNLKDGSTNHPESWFWQASGGVVQNPFIPEPGITFSNPGTKTVTLIVSNNIDSDTITKLVDVYPTPSIVAVVNPSLVGSGHQTTITATGGATYTWTWNNYTLPGQSINLTFTGVGSNQTVSVVGLDSVGCMGKDTLIIHVFAIGALHEVRDIETIKIYPNPVGNELYVTGSLEQKNVYELSFTDVNGREIKKEILNPEGKINTHDLSPGVYFLQIKQSKGLVYKTKIVKE